MDLEQAFAMLPTRAMHALFADAVRGAQLKQLADRDWTHYCPHTPHPGPQTRFLDSTKREVLYGGAAGGGKSDALLMAALRYVHVPGYAAIIFRRTYPMLAAADGLIERSHEWLQGTDARWIANEHKWRWPNGATLTLSHMQYDDDRYNHQGAAYQFIGWDELTQFSEKQYTYLFSRCRRPVEGPLAAVPLRIYSASNPGGFGHVWVKRRFINVAHKDREFIPARLADNPSLDAKTYVENLGELDRVTMMQLLSGNWDVGEGTLLTWEDIQNAEAEQCLWPMGVVPARLSKGAELYVGMDIGRTNDRSVIWVNEVVGDVLWCRVLDVIHRMDFDYQESRLLPWLKLPQTVACRIDKGGIGLNLSEKMTKKFPSKVVGVQLSPGRQGQLALQMRADFEAGRIRIPQNEDLREDLQLVSNAGNVNGVPTIVTERNDTGHADRFWACALARFAMPTVRPMKSGSAPRGMTTRNNSQGQ